MNLIPGQRVSVAKLCMSYKPPQTPLVMDTEAQQHDYETCRGLTKGGGLSAGHDTWSQRQLVIRILDPE